MIIGRVRKMGSQEDGWRTWGREGGVEKVGSDLHSAVGSGLIAALMSESRDNRIDEVDRTGRARSDRSRQAW
jgi:hypothetical protein